MTPTRSLSATALVLLFAGMMAGSAGAQDLNVTELEAGIDRLRALPATVNRARNLLGPLTFGPYEIHGSCDFNCWGKLCWQTWHWNRRMAVSWGWMRPIGMMRGWCCRRFIRRRDWSGNACL